MHDDEQIKEQPKDQGVSDVQHACDPVEKTPFVRLGIIILLAAGSALLDGAMPLGVAGGVPYMAVVILSSRLPQRHATLLTAIVCTGLTLLGFFISPPDGDLWRAVSNRLLAAFAIWVTVLFLLQGKRAETMTRASDERFRHLVEGSIQGIVIHRNFKPLFVNQAYVELMGYETPDEIFEMGTLMPLLAPHERTRLTQYNHARVKGEEVPTQYENQGVRKDGSLIWIDNRVRVVNWEGEPAIQSTVFNITERKLAEDHLHRMNDILEEQVARRTAALTAANDVLRNEIAERQQAEEALQRQAEQLRLLTDALPVLIAYIDYIAQTTSLFGISIPEFWFAIMCILIFSLYLGWLPSSEYYSPFEHVGKSIQHLILTALAIGFRQAAFTTRLTRSSMLDEGSREYVDTARSLGLPESKVMYKYTLRNALIPTLTITGIQFY